jgi:hypothetical protein
MLRALVLLLVLANGGYFAWSQGLLRPYGFAPAAVSEPHRMEQQVRPDAIQVLSADEVKKIEAAASAPVVAAPVGECLQAGLFNEAQATALKQAFAGGGWPDGSWLLEPAVEPARWMVYMGKFPSADALAKKRAELSGLNIKAESVTGASLSPGLSLGVFETQAAANTELTAMGKRGVHTARVVQERAEVSGNRLRLPAADDALKARFDGLKPLLAGRTLQACR